MNIPAHQDTIVAIATAAGVAAIGVLRMSGPDTLAIIKKIFKGKNLRNVPSHTIHFGHIINPEQGGTIIDEVVVSVYRNPKSYTGEDTVEISGHGSPVLLGQILDVCIAQGARLAQPGEFTQRAFLNGKLDLAQAEAVADLIAAQSAAASRTALQQLRGGFSDDLATLRDQLIQFAALIELELDFSDEDVTFADRGQLTALIWTLKDKIGKLIQSFQLGNAIKEGVRIAIIGKPNAGKSTLLNALLNEERAIVSEVAGTTRDSIEELININGVHFRLIDTAGIRAHTEDLIEQHGIARSKANAEQADWILHLIDATDQDTIDEAWLEQYQDKIITIYNKIDKQPYIPSLGTSAIAISAKEKQGIEAVKDMIFQRAIGSSYHREDTIVTNARHKEALDHVYDSLLQIEQGLDSGLSGDLLAIDIRRALYYLGTITGQVEVDRDILGAIFGKFCIGK